MAKSEIWKYFDLRKDTEDGCKLGMCRVCDNDDPSVLRLTGNSTSPLWKHLEKCHPEEHLKVIKSKKKIIQQTSGDTNRLKAACAHNGHSYKKLKTSTIVLRDCCTLRTALKGFENV